MLGIIGAMDIEVEALYERMTETEVRTAQTSTLKRFLRKALRRCAVSLKLIISSSMRAVSPV